MLIVAYLMACLLVAFCGRRRRIGFVGALFLSLLITPILSFLILWMTGPVGVHHHLVHRDSAAARPMR